MGFVFLECLEAKQYYVCGFCRVELVDMTARTVYTLARDWHESATYLYTKMVNVFLGPETDELLLTGRNTVAVVFCCNCCQAVGWRYVRAHDKIYSYKNGTYAVDPSKLTRIRSGSSSG